MFVAKLVLLGLALLPIVAFGLIFKHLVSDDKNRIMASAEDWKEVGLGSGTDIPHLHTTSISDISALTFSPTFSHTPGNIYHTPEPYDPDIYDD